MIYRWQNYNAIDQWVAIDTTDQTSSSGVAFLDARWATNGTTNPYNDPIPTIKSLTTSDYLDLDAPSPSLYPSGMLLWNTRRSGYNVKRFVTDYFNAESFSIDQFDNTETYPADAKVLWDNEIYINTSGGTIASGGGTPVFNKIGRAHV